MIVLNLGRNIGTFLPKSRAKGSPYVVHLLSPLWGKGFKNLVVATHLGRNVPMFLPKWKLSTGCAA